MDGKFFKKPCFTWYSEHSSKASIFPFLAFVGISDPDVMKK
jgi:hypothetical protein